jgi:hypothetical protein
MGGVAPWAFRSFLSDRGESVVEAWRAEQTPVVLAAFDTTLRFLCQRPTWGRPYTGALHGECEGLIEIRLKAERVQHRPLGFYGPLQREFTIVFFAVEKGDELKPRNACSVALQRKALVEVDRNGRSCEWAVE